MNVRDWLEVLAETLREGGVPAHVSGERVILAAALDVRAESLDVQAMRPGEFATAHVVVEAAGLRMNLIGFGTDDLDASRVAARQWIDGAFPVLDTWMHPTHRGHLGAKTFELLSYDHQQNKAFAWRLHLSPVLPVQLGPHRPAEWPQQRAMLEQVFDEFRVITTAERRLLWVEASASRLPDATHSSFCVGDVQWPSCEEALRGWAGRWPPGFGNLMVKQFMLLEHAERAGLGAALQAAFDEDVEVSKSMITAKGGDGAGWVTARLGALGVAGW